MRPLLLVAAFLLIAADARASCAEPNPRQQLKYADAAFAGRFESERREGFQRWLTFRVEQVVKGTVGPAVEIHEPGMSSISFGAFTPGQRVGLMMNFAEGAWRSSACQQVDPDELLDAVKPIPRPPGRGAGRFLVYGRFGDARLAVLDRRGRTIAYGFGGGSGGSVCEPRRDRVIEIGGGRLHVRRLRNLKILSSRRLPGAARVHCLGRDVFTATSAGILRNGRPFWRGRWTGLTFHGDGAFVSRDHAIARVDLRTGGRRRLAVLALPPQHDPLRDVAVSGDRLAVLAPNAPVTGGEPPSKLAVLDLRSGRLRFTDLPVAGIDGTVVWAGDDRLAVLPFTSRTGLQNPARFYTAGLELLGTPDWSAYASVGGGGAVVGVLGHRLMRATPAGASELGRLPGSSVYGLVALGGADVRAPRRVPRY